MHGYEEKRNSSNGADMEHWGEKVWSRFQKENDNVQYNGQKHMHIHGRNMGHRRNGRNWKYTRKVSEEFSRIRDAHQATW